MENNVLAVINDKKILQSDLDALLQSIGPQRAMQFQSPEGQKQLLDELIHQELFLIDGKANKVEESDEFLSELEFVKENMIKQISIKNLLSSVEVNDEELKDFYDKNAEMYKSQAAVTASHILVDDEEKAKNILSEINEGKSFEDAAKEHSSCQSSENGGDLGEFTKGKMVPEFESVAFKLAVNEISDVVSTQFGFHVIKVTNITEAKQETFEDAKEKINQTVLLQKQQEKYLAKVAEIKEDVTVEII